MNLETSKKFQDALIEFEKEFKTFDTNANSTDRSILLLAKVVLYGISLIGVIIKESKGRE